MVKLFLGRTASAPHTEKTGTLGVQSGYAGSHTECFFIAAKKVSDRLRLPAPFKKSKSKWRKFALSL